MANPWEQPQENKKKKEEKKTGPFKKAVIGASMMFAGLNAMPDNASGANLEDAMKEGDLKNDSKTEVFRSSEKQAVEFLGKLFNLPKQNNGDNPLALENAVMGAKALIQAYALQRKGLQSGYASPEDIRAAVEELWNAIDSYADQVHGNNDGKVSHEELLRAGSNGSTNPGIIALHDMHESYSNLGGYTENN